jgi:4-hydroxy-tetrahydrodipicolinate synthase
VLFLVATLTPFDSRGRVDLARLRAHVLWLATQGVDGFVPTGSTGEFLYLSDREREAVHRTVLDAVRGRPVYPCTWDPSPQTTRYLTDAAREQGATGILIPPPLYYQLDDDVIEAWYRYVAATANLPMLAYHQPDFIPSHLSPERYLALRKEGILAGMKDSSGDLYRLQRMAAQDPGAVYAGGDAMLAQIRKIKLLGGVISALGNVWPSFCVRLMKGEVQLDQALADRIAGVRAGGGLRALKGVLGMGCRAPLIAASGEAVIRLPPSEFPK